MIDTHELKKRDLYLNKIIAFQDTEPVKVVTGIRRCGKSSLLKLMTFHLKETGITEDQILEMNFESHNFKNMTGDSFYEYVKQHVQPDKRMYLFFDEVQRVPDWEDAINSFRVDFNCDIYVTGSNAYMLSSEYATYLSGRCVEIKMLPLSFSEFLTFHDFEIRETKSALGGTRKQAFDINGEHYELREVFDAYMRFGGMPGIADVGLDQEKALVLLEGIYSTVIMRDILERENRRGQKRITDPVLLKKIVMFLADNIGSSISVSSIGNTLVNEGLLFLTFEDDEEHIINRIISCVSEDIEVLKHKAFHKEELCFEELYIDKRKRVVVCKENEIDLTYTEFEILLLLAQNAGIVFNKERIYDRIWKEPYYGDYNIVMSHIRNIREKIEDNPSKTIYIQTV